MKILVAGAGIGGLTAALCLHKHGHEVVLVEQAEQFLEVGAGIQLGANALHVFDYLGLIEKIRPYAVAPNAIQMRDHQSGDLFYEIALAAEYQQRYGAPYWHIHRADLHAVLAAEVAQGLLQNLKLGCALDNLAEEQDRVIVTLSTGEQLAADCVIGADGVNSRVREILFGVNKPNYTGAVAWRGAKQ